jgi:hypothetical protein
MLDKISELHQQFGITAEAVRFEEAEKIFRIRCLQEELDEYSDAAAPEDELDALVDLVVFAFGTAERQGYLPVFEEAFNRVMVANMQKELGPNTKRGGFQIDMVKPEGWVAPDLTDLVGDK